MNTSARSLATILSALGLAAFASCSPTRPAALGGTARTEGVRPLIATPDVSETTPRDYPGIHNAVAYHHGFVSGSAPEGDNGFETLAAMGIKTIISVDGAEPAVHQATSRGMRYIHLPIGYNGFDEQRRLELVRATRDAMKNGAVYIHCHHGKHRSAAAAAAVAASLGWVTPEGGVERMKVSGTAPIYKGLYACARASRVLDASVIASAPADFPSVSRPSGFVKGMVEMDEVYEHLKAIEKAGWGVPKDHPDLVPAAEAGRLADLYRMLRETSYAARKPSEFAQLLSEAHRRAQTFEDLLTSGETDASKLAAQFQLVSTSCKDCHAKYRD